MIINFLLLLYSFIYSHQLNRGLIVIKVINKLSKSYDDNKKIKPEKDVYSLK